ncbi:EamA family transporter [Dyella monticola]|uniref:EamA family transporter n=1 Tax=Dyella monticola TaxID=1927958 RepID=A0A370WYN0_9GAMM|nr:EamA family transporter [Dyella monticola]RDS81222.1 EamA family transporter [Dyella monticola]
MNARTWRFYLCGFALLLVFDTIVQVSFKLTGAHAFPPQASGAWVSRIIGQPWIYVALIGYVGNFFTWMSLLKHAPIGPAFAASHLDVVSVMLASAWLFHDALTPMRLLGAGVIMMGITCLAFAESRTHGGQDKLAQAHGPLGAPADD